MSKPTAWQNLGVVIEQNTFDASHNLCVHWCADWQKFEATKWNELIQAVKALLSCRENQIGSAMGNVRFRWGLLGSKKPIPMDLPSIQTARQELQMRNTFLSSRMASIASQNVPPTKEPSSSRSQSVKPQATAEDGDGGASVMETTLQPPSIGGWAEEPRIEDLRRAQNYVRENVEREQRIAFSREKDHKITNLAIEVAKLLSSHDLSPMEKAEVMRRASGTIGLTVSQQSAMSVGKPQSTQRLDLTANGGGAAVAAPKPSAKPKTKLVKKARPREWYTLDQKVKEAYKALTEAKRKRTVDRDDEVMKHYAECVHKFNSFRKAHQAAERANGSAADSDGDSGHGFGEGRHD